MFYIRSSCTYFAHYADGRTDRALLYCTPDTGLGLGGCADALESNQINPFIRAQQAKWLEKGVPLICIFAM